MVGNFLGDLFFAASINLNFSLSLRNFDAWSFMRSPRDSTLKASRCVSLVSTASSRSSNSRIYIEWYGVSRGAFDAVS